MTDAPILSDDESPSFPSIPTTRGGDPDALGRIDHYDVLRKLGGGGFGVVYLARDSVSGVEVALKTLHPLLKNNAEEMDLLREKFKLVHGLTHPNIAKALVLHLVREINVWDAAARAELKLSPGDSVMVMDYAPGITLSKWRRQFPGGVVPPDLALEVGRQVAEALDYAHSERIVHRDIKPGNIMVETVAAEPQAFDHDIGKVSSSSDPQLVTSKIRVRILDFGLAAEIRSSMSRVSTESGDTSGTRPYMAPEQWLGRKQNAGTDQYALACVVYELLSGAPPFAGVFETGDPAIMKSAVIGDAPEEIEALSPSANAALLRSLAKDPAARFPSCAAFVEAFVKGRDASTSRPPHERAEDAPLLGGGEESEWTSDKPQDTAIRGADDPSFASSRLLPDEVLKRLHGVAVGLTDEWRSKKRMETAREAMLNARTERDALASLREAERTLQDEFVHKNNQDANGMDVLPLRRLAPLFSSREWNVLWRELPDESQCQCETDRALLNLFRLATTLCLVRKN